MEKKFQVSDDLINKINMGKNPIEIHIAGTLCIFNYDRSSFDSSETAKTLTNHIQEILEQNKDYKVICINSNEDLNLIFVVFDLKN